MIRSLKCLEFLSCFSNSPLKRVKRGLSKNLVLLLKYFGFLPCQSFDKTELNDLYSAVGYEGVCLINTRIFLEKGTQLPR